MKKIIITLSIVIVTLFAAYFVGTGFMEITNVALQLCFTHR